MRGAGVEVELKFEESWEQFQMGFLQGSNPRAYKRLLVIAAMNAGRTMQKPMQAAAPKRTGRLGRSISTKAGRYQQPSATVGPRPGGTRGDSGGAWYRYFVTSGHKVRGVRTSGSIGISWGQVAAGIMTPKQSASSSRIVAARPFVTSTAKRADIQQKALGAFWETMAKFMNDEVFRNKITKFKRKGR